LTVYRVTQPGDDQAVDVDAIGAIEGVVRAGKPGRYPIDQIDRDPLPSGHTSRRWGVGINDADGTAAIEPDPWPER
jgi:hypothetical protein